jgi:hypothetical protein
VVRDVQQHPSLALRLPGQLAALVAAGLLLVACATGAPAPAADEGDASAPAAPGAPAAAGEADAAASGDAAAPGPVTPEELLAATTAASVPSAGSRLSTLDPATDPTAVSDWLVDEERGRRYYLARMPQDAVYRRLPDGTVRTRYAGITVRPDSEDEDYLYYRVYDTSGIETMVLRPKLTPEQKAAVAESYRFAERRDDRLRFAPFDEGLPKSGQWRNGFALGDMNGDGHLDLVHGPQRKAPGQSPLVYLGDGAGHWSGWPASYPPMRYDYGDVAVADFDGDGRQDIAVAMHLIGLAVLVQREPGVFASWGEGLDYEVAGEGGAAQGFSSRVVEAVDWNGDGRPDLLALGEGPRLQTANTVELTGRQAYGAVAYLNAGDGTWRRVDQGTGSQHVFGDDLALADLDGDGRPDFITATSAMGRRDLLHRGVAGEPPWEAATLADLRPHAFVPAVAAGDLDGDGRVDLAVSFMSYQAEAWHTGVDLMLQRPGGAWERRALWNQPGREAVTALAAGDLDGDGDHDLVALTQEGGFMVWLADGGGSFTAEESAEAPHYAGCTGYHVVVRDLDGDGRGDVVAAFAGEPGSEVLFDPSGPRDCPRQGALVALRSESP